MKNYSLLLFLFLFGLKGFAQSADIQSERQKDSFYIQAMNADGVKMIAVRNQKYQLWTKKAGTGKIKLLLLHGGPGTSPEYFENFPVHLGENYTVYFYSQLGSYFSDIPTDSLLYNVDSFIDDVEEVRKSLDLDQFYLLGHSWGSQLAQAYASKYQKNLKGLLLCNNINEKDEVLADYQTQLYAAILDSVPEFAKYADSLRFGFSGKFTDFSHPTALGYQIRNQAWPIMLKKHYARVLDPMPLALRLSKEHSTGGLMSEIGFMEKISTTDFNMYLVNITVPTLFIGAKYDFIPPHYYVKMRDRMTKNPDVSIYICPMGSHFPMWDDPIHFFEAVDRFIMKTEKMKRNR